MSDNISISVEQFEQILDDVVARLTEDLRNNNEYHTPDAFEEHVKTVMQSEFCNFEPAVESTFHASAFPDIKVGSFGIEVKYTNKDKWHTVGNSIFEGMRDEDVKNIYLIFGKSGGTPEVRWRRYEDCITDVRLTHAPSFAIDMDEPSLLFNKLSTSYNEFSELSEAEKLITIKEFYSSILEPDERLWWMAEEYAPPIQVRMYAQLSKQEKNKLRAEAAILFPQICGESQIKYIDPALYFLKYYNVFCQNTRDLFSSKFAADEGKTKSGNPFPNETRHVLHTLLGLKDEMLDAIRTLDGEQFIEHWGEGCPQDERLAKWIKKADESAKGWKPSNFLFLDSYGEDRTNAEVDLRLFEL